MSESWKARKMVPGKDTISTMALHYGTNSGTLIEVIRVSGADVIRDDGYKGPLVRVHSRAKLDGTLRNRNRNVLGWGDGKVGVNPAFTLLTTAAIRAVAQWKIEQQPETVAA